VELVKEIIVNLARDIEETCAGKKSMDDWSSVPVERFLRRDQSPKSVGSSLDSEAIAIILTTCLVECGQ